MAEARLIAVAPPRFVGVRHSPPHLSVLTANTRYLLFASVSLPRLDRSAATRGCHSQEIIGALSYLTDLWRFCNRVNDYYSPLDNVLTIRELQEDRKKLDLSSNVMMEAIGRLAKEYEGPQILSVDYALLALQAQTVTRNKLADRLSLPWWNRYPLTGRVVNLLVSALRNRKVGE
jgi:hypothetical protein